MIPKLRPAWWVAAGTVLVLVVVVAAFLLTSGGDEGDPLAATGPSTTATTEATTLVPVTTAPPPTLAPETTTTTSATTTSATPTTAPRPTTTTLPFSTTVSPAGVGPLRLGMTTRQATETGAVGPYRNSEIAPAATCGGATPRGAYRPDDFSPLFVDGKLVRFYFGRASRLRTPQGIASGTAVARLSAVPGTRTESPHPYVETQRNIDIISGGVGYQFTIADGVVEDWSIGTTAGLSLVEGCA